MKKKIENAAPVFTDIQKSIAKEYKIMVKDSKKESKLMKKKYDEDRKQSEALIQEAIEYENKVNEQDYLIRSTGMRLDALAEILKVSLDTMKSYSAGRRIMPVESVKKIEELIKKIKG